MKKKELEQQLKENPRQRERFPVRKNQFIGETGDPKAPGQMEQDRRRDRSLIWEEDRREK